MAALSGVRVSRSSNRAPSKARVWREVTIAALVGSASSSGSDLLMGGGVIDHHKDPASLTGIGGQHRSIQTGPILRVRGNVLARDGQGTQEPL